MTIRYTAEQRQAITDAKRIVRALERPAKAQAKAERTQARKDREKAVGERPEGQRQPSVKDRAYLSWIRGLPCIACTIEGHPTRARCEAAHVRAGYAEDGWRPTGMAEKSSDRRTTPLCASHHRAGPKAQHKSGERGWWAALNVYPPTFCAALSQAYDFNQDGVAVVHDFARKARHAPI